jgi:hypothetical protein
MNSSIDKNILEPEIINNKGSNSNSSIPTINAKYSSYSDANYNIVDMLLEKEKQTNKGDTWNKIDKTVKIQKLHAFAEKYGREHNIPIKEVKNLKIFFVNCLEKMKLQKAKDVICDKETKEIISIPSLHFNTTTKNFTLKIVDNKRVSTMKSLTPKRSSDKNKSNSTINSTDEPNYEPSNEISNE